MSKSFGSLDEMVAYIKKCQEEALLEVGKEMVDIFNEEIETQVYDDYSPSVYKRNNWLRDSAEIEENSKDFIVAGLNMYAGGWTSLYGSNKGQYFYPMYGLESGSTWGRGGTNIMSTVEQRCESEVPKVFKKAMSSMGVPIK